MFGIIFSKALDTVCREKRITKMHELGVAVEVIKWASARLRNRERFVEIFGARSLTLPLTSGVPQGSVSGHILFLLYKNDFGKSLHSSIDVVLFADYCVLFARVRNIADNGLLNDALCAVEKWCGK